MFDFNAIPQSIAFAKICSNLQKRHDQVVEDLANVEKDEEIIGLRRVILEKDEIINTLKQGLLAVEENQEFERKKKGLTHNERNNLYENKDRIKFCTKCVHERKDFVPVGRTCSKEKERWICKVCDKPYTSIDADARLRQETEEAWRTYNR